MTLAARVRARLRGRAGGTRPGDTGPSATPYPQVTPPSAVAGVPIQHGFFDEYAGYLRTSRTSASASRLNLRHEAIFGTFGDVFDDAAVLDIASHDGRWSMASLQAGARHVVGIEPRLPLVESARRSMEHYGVGADRYRFVQGDVFEVLRDDPVEADVVLCLGFYYHTLRHLELMALMSSTGATALVLDTEIHPGGGALIRVGQESTERQGNAIADAYSPGDVVLTGRPTLEALVAIAASQGFELAALADWASLLRCNPDAGAVRDYRTGRRATALFTK